MSRRLGAASKDFKALCSLWNHVGLSCLEKFAIYRSCICSKLLYGLQSAWINKALRTKLDGFHARCIRRILGVLPSYWSRVSNKDILERVHATPLSNLLLEQQLIYFGKLFRLPSEDYRRRMIFESESETLRNLASKRRQGRPRLQWIIEVNVHTEILSGGL